MLFQTMLAIILLFAGCTNSQKIATTTQKEYQISGNVTVTNSYCGGAPPSNEMLQKITAPKSYVGKKFHVRLGEINTSNTPLLKSFTVDENGNFSIQLPAGKYAIIQDEQASPMEAKALKRENIKVDELCLKKWWEKPYYILEVKNEAITNLKFEFHKRCFINSDIPCLQYTGPMPP